MKRGKQKRLTKAQRTALTDAGEALGDVRALIWGDGDGGPSVVASLKRAGDLFAKAGFGLDFDCQRANEAADYAARLTSLLSDWIDDMVDGKRGPF